jgi:hypothetical protein
MWNERLTILFKEFFNLGGSVEAQDLFMQSSSLLCDDVAFTLLPAENEAVGLRVFAQFGAPPSEKITQILRRLLEINLFMPHGRDERLAIDPASGCVIFSYTFFPASAAALLTSLRQAASHARAWRFNYFLDDEPEMILAQA